METGGMLIPPYVATLPVFEKPAARYPPTKADWLVAKVKPRRFGIALPLTSPGSSTCANLTVGFATAAASTAEVIKKPTPMMRLHFASTSDFTSPV